jgi:hypothetical protein
MSIAFVNFFIHTKEWVRGGGLGQKNKIENAVCD